MSDEDAPAAEGTRAEKAGAGSTRAAATVAATKKTRRTIHTAPWGGHWLDAAYARRTYRGRTFAQGFGDLDAVRALSPDAGTVGALEVAAPLTGRMADAAQTLTFSVDHGGATPPEVRSGQALLLAPEGTPRFAVVFVGATGDETLSHRETWARALLPSGAVSVIAETPYYGSRRPPGQDAHHIRTVADLGRLYRAQVIEVALFAGYMRRRFSVPVIAVGTSRGAQASVLSAMLAEGRGADGTVAFLAPHHAAPVYIEGVLRNAVDWGALAKEAGSVEAAESELREFFAQASFDAFEPSGAGELTFIHAKNDGFVPPDAPAYFRAHFPQAHFVTTKGGHVSSFARGQATLLRAIRRTAATLIDAHSDERSDVVGS